MTYIPKTWTLDDPVTKADLDHIEGGIEDVTDAYETYVADRPMRMEADTGTQSTVPPGDTTTAAIVFTQAFLSAPVVIAVAKTVSPEKYVVTAGTPTTAGVTLYCHNLSGVAANIPYSWLAVGV